MDKTSAAQDTLGVVTAEANMPKPTVSFSHVGIFVTDLERMLAFYRDVIGLSVTDRGIVEGTEIIFMSADPKEHHQVVIASGRPADLSFTTVNQLSFRLESLTALRQMLGVLRAANVQALAPTNHGTALSIYFPDPEGNRVELFIDTPWHIEQPQRHHIDFDRSEDEIWSEVEKMVTDHPTFQTFPERHAEMVELMSKGH
jgi:catechol-2,3-dioxygenase